MGRRTQRPNLSGDVLELADALGYGMGYSLSTHAPPHAAIVNWLTAVLLLLLFG
jgi:hypothetical protein